MVLFDVSRKQGCQVVIIFLNVGEVQLSLYFHFRNIKICVPPVINSEKSLCKSL